MTNKSEFVTAYFYDAFFGAMANISLSRANYIAEVKQRIKCSFFDVARLDDNHDVFVDDNGLTDGLHTIVRLKDFPNPFAGNLVIVGRDEHGDIAEPRMTVEEIAEMITVYRPVMDPELTNFERPDLIGVGLTGLNIRMDKSEPIIVVDGEF